MVFLLLKSKFDKYKKVSSKVIDLLISENCSSLYDIKIIYNIIMGFPYCVDGSGHYIYKGRYYNSIKELPMEALKQLLSISN